MTMYLLVGVIGAIWAAAVASSKNNSAIAWGLAGLQFPLFGVIGAHLARPTERLTLNLAGQPAKEPWQP